MKASSFSLPSFATLLLLIGSLSLISCSGSAQSERSSKSQLTQTELDKYSKAYFASGCFWCVEAIFESVEGVKEVISGYSGGAAETATYEQVSSGRTRHAEAVEVYFDPEIIEWPALLEIFFGSHDPTTLNQQGPDRGPQYRSVIYYQTDFEKAIARAYIEGLERDKAFKRPIVTELVPFEKFFAAEDYHQDFERRNPNQGYVQAVSIPRLKKFQKKFPNYLKKDH